MNFVSKFDGSLSFTGTHPKAQLHVETAQTRAPSDAIVVKDANLLFNGDFKRTGLDLVISRDDQELVLPDYFKADKRAALASSDGAYLTGKTIEVLTGHVQVAQADGSAAAAKIIGHVTKLSGSATVVRNGVSIVLNNGDTVYQGDVVQSGSNSTLGITFIDGSVFGLASNARMVLNEMVYDPNGSGNSSFLTLVQGTISFVAGATAKHGDMKVDTPVATMGIRGTAVLAEIDFEVTIPGTAPPVRFQVLVEPDGTTGSYVLLDRVTLTQIATVNQPGTVTTVSGAGAVSFLASAQLSPELMKLISEVFSQKFTDNSNPKSDTHFTDTIIPQATFPVQFASGETGTATLTVIAASEGTSGPPVLQPKAPDRIPGPPGVVTSNQVLAELPALTGSSLIDTTSGTVSYTDLNPGDTPTVSTAFNKFAYANAAGVTVTSTLTSAQLSAIAAASVPLTVVQDPAGKNNGTATWTYNVEDNALDFLAQGEKLTLTYMARVDNNFAANNEFSFAPFTITITGTNDTPTIESEAQTAEIEELAGEVDSDEFDTATGTIEFEDVDLTDEHEVSITGVAASGTLTGLPGGALPNSTVLNWLSLGDFVDSTDGVTGSQVWNFSAEDHYFDYLAEGETLTLTYTVEVEDNNGATVTEDVVVTVTGTNDAPELAIDTSGDNGLHAITELEGVTGDDTDDTASGSLTFRDVDLSDTHGVSASVPVFNWTNSYGQTLTVSQINGLTVASTFELTLHDSTGTGNGSIDFEYNAADYFFDFLAEGETLTITYDVTVLDEHNVASIQPVTITVTGSNDVPVAEADVGGGIVEAGHDANNDPVPGNATTSGNVLDNDTDVDQTDTHEVVGVAAGTATAALSTGVGLEIEGIYGKLTLNANGTWTYTLDNDDPDTNALPDGAQVTDVFSYTQSDPFGATSTTTLTINITGTNDEPVTNFAPVAATDTNEGDPVVEQGVNPGNTAFPGVASAEGNVLANDYDVDTGDTKTVQSVTNGTTSIPVAGLVGTQVAGTYGTLTIFADGTWTYTLDNDNPATQALAQGESVTDEFSYTMHDTLGSTSSATLSIAITGTNDVPTVAAALTDAADEGDPVFTQNLLDGASDVDDGAILAVANVSYAVDGGAASLTPPVGISRSGSTLTVDPSDPAFDHLAVDDTMTIVVTYDVTDEHGATVQQTETIVITGTNDTPTVATALTDTADEGAASFTQDLLEGASDLDDGETATLAVTNVTYSVNGGTASPTAPAGVSLSGSTLTVDPADPAFDHLAAGVTMVIVVSYDVIDAQGATVPQTETITVTGTNDVPVLSIAPAASQSLVNNLVGISVPVGSQDAQSHPFNDGVWSVTGLPGQLNNAIGIGYLVNPSIGNDFITPTYSLHGHTYIAPYVPDPTKYVITFQFDTPMVVTGLDVMEHVNGVTILHGYVGNSLNSMISVGSSIGSLGNLQGPNLMYNGELNEFQFNNTISGTYFQVVVEGTSLSNGFAFFRMTPEGNAGNSIAEAPGATGSSVAASVSGVLNFTDPDHIDSHTFEITGVTTSGNATNLPDNDALKGWLSFGAKTESINGATGTQAWTFSAADGNFDYLAEGEYVTFTYTIEIDDGHGGTAAQEVSVTITGTNDDPVITSNGGGTTASVSVVENTTAVTTVQATDVDNTGLTYAILTGNDSPDAGLFSINPTTGELSFTDPPNYESPGSFAGSNIYTVQVQVSDGAGGIDIQTLTVEVTDTGETLQANADLVSTSEDTPITLSTLTANDTVAGGGTPTIVSVGNATHGTVTLNGGNPVFTPDPGFSGQASFTYWITEAENPAPAGTFQSPTSSATGSGPYAVGTADLNGDGKLDLVVTNNTGANLSVLLGNGDGTFGLQTTYATGTHPFAVELEDIDGDNDVDIVVANLGSNSISVMLGDGTGSFAAQQTYATGTTHPQAVQLGDFNGDGKLDVVTSGASGNAISLLLGNGDGTFGTASTFATAGYATGVEIGDFNGDGNLDVVSSNYNTDTVSVLLGDGLGGFSPYSSVSVGDYVIGVVVADFNGDGKLDFATANNSSNNISVLIGNGDGTFQTQVNYATGTGPAYISTTDFDQDGTLDLVVTNASNTVSVFRGNGNGTFAAAVNYAAATTPGRVATGDFNGDGLVDIAVADSSSDTVNVLLNGPAGETLSSATVTVNVVAPAAPQLIGETFLGGAGDQAASSVEYVNGHLYLTYNGPVTQTTSDYANVVSFSTELSAPPTQDFSLAWTKGFFNGVTSDGTNIYAVGASYPGTLLTSDGSGGAEVKTLLAMFNANGTAGTNPSFAPATDYAATNFFGYRGVEIFYDVLATEQGGETVLYAVGFGQPSSYGAYVIAAYDANGDLLYPAAVDPLPVPGFSVAYEAVEFNGQIWAVGYTEHSGDPVGRAVVWAASYDLSTVVTYKNEIETSPAAFNGAAVIGSNLYAVGYVGEPYQYLITKYNTDGSIAWSTSFGGAGDDVLTDAVSINGHLYVVGYTTDTSGNTDGVLMEISTVNGSVISTTSYGGALYDAFNSITTDGRYLYVAGESNSFTNGGNGAGENDAILLTFDPGLGPVINTANFEVSSSGNNTPTTVTGLSVTDPNADEILTLTATTAEAAAGSTITPSSGSGVLSAINSAIGSVTYDPGSDPPETDMVTFTVTGASGTDTVHFVFNEAGNGPGIELYGTTGKDVIFATDDDDTLTGYAGLDQFVFTPVESGSAQHTITDFETAIDKLDIRQFAAIDGLEDFTVTQVGNDTLIALDANDTILLQNVLATNIQASNFIFHA